MFEQSTMRIAERKQGKNVFSKFLAIGIPTLDMVSDSLPAPDSWKEETVTEGEQQAVVRTPVYEDDKLAYVQDAIIQRIQGLARSRDKTGQTACMTWEEVAESGGSGVKYPILLKEFREKFASWMSSATELNDKQQAALLSYTDSKLLLRADQHKKERVAEFLAQFVESLGEEALSLASVINVLNRSLETEQEDVDF